MEKLSKTVSISCLIYGLYGLVSWLDVGAFVPPIPLKPFLFVAFLLAFVFSIRQNIFTSLNISFLLWLVTLVFVGQYLVETFFDFEFVHLYMNSIEPFILLGSIFAFIVFVFNFSRKIGSSSIRIFILLLLSILIFTFILLIGKHFVYDWGIAIITLLFFIFNRNNTSLSENTQKIQIILNGVAILNVLEQLAFLLQ